MKNLKYLSILLFAIFLGTSCDQKGTTSATDPETFKKKFSFPHNIPKAQDGALPVLRKFTKDYIVERQRSMKENVSELTYYYVCPQYFSNQNIISAGQELVRHWMKFENDYTYHYGIGPETIGSGIYHYAPSDQRLVMLDDDPLVEPKMWTLLSNSEFINFLGQPLLVYRDKSKNEFLLENNFANDAYLEQLGTAIAQAHNGMQIKMMLLDNHPI